MAAQTPPEQADTGILTPDVIEKLKKSDDAKKLVAWVNSEFDKSKSARLPFERQWYLNYAFYKGRQYVTRRPQGAVGAGLLSEPKAAPWRVRATVNRIKPIIRTELSKLTSNKPNASVVPASTDDDDLFAAQAGEAVWEYLYSTKQIHKTFRRSMFWLVMTGTSFIKDWWDPTAIDADHDEYGDIKYGSVTPFHLYIPDLYEEDIEDQPYLFNAYTKPVEWVSQTYGSTFNANTVSIDEIMGNGFFQMQSGQKAKPDSVLVKEAWIKPGSHKLFPDGGMITLVDETIVGLYDQGLPYAHKEYPFTKFTHIPTGHFYGDSVINDLISPQKDYNRTKSQIIESKNLMAKPKLLAAMGSIDPKKITSQPGQVVLYRPGLPPPQPLPLQPLPGYVTQELDRAVADMEDISSQHEVSKGTAPAGVTAATAISFLQERDDAAMSTTYQDIEAGYEKIAKHSLSHVVQYWDTPRIVKTTGVDGAFDSISLKGSEVASGTDIRIEAGSALPVSKAARQAFLMDLMKMGFIDPNKGLSMMDMGGIEKLFDEMKADERQAQRENLRMRSLELDKIEQRLKEIEQVTYINDQIEQTNQQVAAQQGSMVGDQLQAMQPTQPPETANAQQQMAYNSAVDQQMAQPPAQPAIPAQDYGYGIDPNSGMSNLPPANVVPVNTWDNHQIHIDVHNRFRKSQAFEMLPQQIRDQFEAHVMMHAAALNSAAGAAATMAPGPNMQPNDMGGAMNSSGMPTGPQSPVGNNQFGPPGSSDNGAVMPPAGG